MVSCISTCFYFPNILELKWQEEEGEDHTHIAEGCHISDILLNLLLLCSVRLKCDEVFGIFSVLFGNQVSGLFSAALELFVHTYIKSKNQRNRRNVLSRMDTSSSQIRTDIALSCFNMKE